MDEPDLSSAPPPPSTEVALRAATPTPTDPTVCASGVVPAPLPAETPAGTPYGRYVLLAELGRGGMGIVWKAWDTHLKRVVALKQILPRGAVEPAEVERFVREARLAAKLHHPNVVSVHDVGVQEGKHFFTADFIEGRPLSEAVKGPVPSRQAATLLLPLAEALAYAHGQGVVHRDMKPSNVLVDRDGKPYVMDFGLAKEVEVQGDSRQAGLTRSGAVLGTPHYMSPEQAGGESDRVGPATDQFSLGVMMYELLAGRRPFEGDTSFEITCALLGSDPTPPCRVKPSVHRDLETICLKALERNPSHRYASVADMAADLRRYLEGDPILARPLSTLARAARRARKHAAVLVPTAVAALLLLGIGAWLVAARARRAHDFDEALRAGREWKAHGRSAEARDAFQRALVADPSCDEACAGVAWADEQQRAVAEAAAQGRVVVRKSALVAGVLARWAALDPTLRALQQVRSAGGLTREERVARAAPHWERVQEFMDATPTDPTSQAAMKAFAGWAKWQAGEKEQGIAWIEEARRLDADVPYGAVMRAILLLTEYLAVDLPAILWGERARQQGRRRSEERRGPLAWLDRKRVEEARAAFRKTHERCKPLMDEAARAQVWGAEVGQATRNLIDAVEDYNEWRLKEAERKLDAAESAPGLQIFRGSILQFRGLVRLLRLDVKDGLADFAEAIRLDPNSPGAYFSRGSVREWTGNLKGALEDYDRCVDLDPGAAHAFEARGRVRKRQGDARGALADFAEVARIRSDSAEAWRQVGLLRYEGGDSQGALADLDRAVQLDPEDLEALVLRAIVAHVLGDLDRAIADCDRALSVDPGHAPALLERGVARSARGDRDGALEDMTRAIECNPGYPEAWYNRGQVLAAKGDIEAAIRDYDEALRLRPRYPEALTYRARAREKKGDVEGALADYDSALEAAPPGWPHRKRVEEMRERARRPK